MEQFAPPVTQLGAPALGSLDVASAPTPGQGLALDVKGKIPVSVLPKFITGIVASDGTITAGTGFSVTNDSTGVYTVTFTNAFSAVPTVILTALVGGVSASISGAVGKGSFALALADIGNVVSGAAQARNAAFNFLAHTTS